MNNINALQIIITVLGSGAIFSFLQFLIQRKDTQAEHTVDDKFKTIETKIDKGLDAREKTGAERFEKHEKNIREMMEVHQEDFKKLIQAFEDLKESDKRIESTINQMAEKQSTIMDALNGLAHDKIVYMTDKISERGVITLKERATLDSIYIPYKAMGGNSHAKAGYEHVIELEVVSDEKAKELDDKIKIKRRFNAVDNTLEG
jgi:hypothetical protein